MPWAHDAASFQPVPSSSALLLLSLITTVAFSARSPAIVFSHASQSQTTRPGPAQQQPFNIPVYSQRGSIITRELALQPNRTPIRPSSTMSSSSPAPESWISSFCSLLGHEYFAEVSEDFIEDDFNLTGLQSQVPMYKEALEMILDVEPEEDEDSAGSDEEEDEDEEEEEDDGVLGDDAKGAGYRRASERRHMRVASDLSVIESSAEMLYGLIHQRYITSRPGIQQMAEKYELQHFGLCPRVFCNGCRVLPVGHSDMPCQDTVKLFCPSCLDIYTPPNSRFQSVDGAFFGTTFGCLFFMTFPELDVGARAEGLSVSPSSVGTDKLRSSPLSASTPNQNNGLGAAGGSSLAATAPEPPPANQPATINGVAPANLAPGLGAGKVYEPRIYGFRVSERARSGPRMKWLRSRPADVNELDEVRRFGDPDDDSDAAADDDALSRQESSVARRRKAPVRKRRQQQQQQQQDQQSAHGAASSGGAGAGAGAGGSPMDTNGVGDGV